MVLLLMKYEGFLFTVILIGSIYTQPDPLPNTKGGKDLTCTICFRTSHNKKAAGLDIIIMIPTKHYVCMRRVEFCVYVRGFSGRSRICEGRVHKCQC